MFIGHFDFDHPLLWTVDDVLTGDECAALIRRAEAGPWLAATVNSFDGRIVRPEVRDSDTYLLDDPTLAELIFERARPRIPPKMSGLEVSGVVPRLRIYRYSPGQHFGLHNDQSYGGPNGTRSLLTFMVYLNDDFEGGATEFPDQETTIVPKAGMGLLFQHMLLHEGANVIRGTKHVLRSDVLYRRVS